MDYKKILASIGDFFKKIWIWLKPYLSKLSQWRKRIWKKYQINKVLLLVVLVTILGTSIYLFFLAKSVNVSTLKSSLAQVTTIYDKDGDEAGQLYGEKGTFVGLDKVSGHIVDALLSTEDKRFYEHKGFDIRGIGRAAVGIVTQGRITGGGSTLTQQLAKNAFLTLDQKLSRKAKELFMAIEIEKAYTKDEILEMYLNHAYFANGVWGVEDASHKYFGKSASDVTVDEAAVLVGMLKGPGIYNPIDNFEKSKERRDIVLDLMVTNEKLAQADADRMKQDELHLVDDYASSKRGYQFPSFFDAVINEAENRHNISADDLLNKGYKIYTTLDQVYQRDMDATFENDALFPLNAADGEPVQGASIAIEPTTGGVRAVAGGRGEHTYRGQNRATQSYLLPGSTMKPLAVYTPALEAGYKPEDILKDEKLSFYDVENYDKFYRGDVPMYQALAESLNASAVWLLNEIGVDKGAKKVEKFGIKLDERDYYPGIALGGMTKGATPMQMASAYTVFANQGRRKNPHFIRKIVDATGAVVVDNEEAKSTQVTTPEVAQEMTSMMQGVFSSGTGMAAQPYGFKMAGKTGTTENVNVDGQARDQWIIGYTPDIVVATWIGFDVPSEVHFLTGSSGEGVSRIFKDETQRILAHSPNTAFEVADASVQAKEEEESKTGDWQDSLDSFGKKVKDGADYWGNRVKEGAGAVKDSFKDFWDSVAP